MRKAAAIACFFALVPALALAGSPSEAPTAARFNYTAYMGGVKIGYAVMDVSVGAGRYAATLSMETGGLAGLLFDWRHGSSAYGAERPDPALPFAADAYLNASIWEGKNRYVEVAYADGVAEIGKANPHPIQDERRQPVAPQLRRDALDPLSAIVAVGRTIEATGKCDADFGVFDGRRLYRFVVSDTGEAELERNSYAPFGGEARRCEFEFKRVAGFKKKPKGPPTKGRAYYRRAREGAPIMPVQVIADSKYGATILHLKATDLIDPELAELAARKLDVTKLD